MAPDGTKRFRREVLLAFCTENPGLRATKKVRSVLEHQHDDTADDTAVVGPRGGDIDIESLRSVARDMRTAAASTMQAALVAARQAEEVARRHREQLEKLAETLAAYDDALTGITAPGILND